MARRVALSCAVLAHVEVLESRVLLSAMPTLWTSHGPGGGGAFFKPVIAPDGQNLWVNSDMSGIYHSGDYGQSWQMQPFHIALNGINGSRDSEVVCTSDPTILYIADTLRGVVKSTDGGTTWNTITGWTNGSAYWMAVAPSNSGKILVANDSNLYLSTNSGASFNLVYNSSNLYVAGAFWESGNVYLGTNKGLLTLTTGGTSFTTSALPNGQAILSFTGAQQGGTNRLMAITTPDTPGPGTAPTDLSFGALYRLDVGGNWSPLTVPAGNAVRFVAMSRVNTSIAYLGGTDSVSMTQVLKTTDGGTTWSDVFQTGFPGDGANPNQNIYSGYEGRQGSFDYWWGGMLGLSVAPNDPNRVVESDAGFIHTTTDGGTFWHEAYTSSADANPPGQATPKYKAYHGIGLENTAVWWLQWLSSTNMFASYADTNGFRSSDGGASWAYPNYNLLANNTVYNTQLAADGKLYASTSNVHMMYILNMTDAMCNPMKSTGQSFDQDGRVIVSTDQGATWSVIHDFAHPVVWVQLDPSNPNRMYAAVVDGPTSSTGGTFGGIWVTNNLNLGVNSTWTKLANPPRTEGHPFDIRILNDGSLVVSYSARRAGSPEAFTRSSGVFYSTDGGQTWQDRTLINVNNIYGAPDMSYYTRDVVIDPTDPTQNTWYACVYNGWGGKGNETGDVYRTADRGLHWTRMQLYLATAYPRGNGIAAQSITINPVTHEMYVTTDSSGLLYTPDATKIGLSYTDFTDVTSFPFASPDRVFINPYDSRDVWITTVGGGIWEGGVGPDQVNAKALGATQVQVRWADNSDNEAGFEIDRATDANFTQNVVTTATAANATSATISGLSPSTTYYFRVRAVNGRQKSANSAVISTTTAPLLKAAFQINDGSVQRSMITSLTFTFSEPVTLASDALSLVLRRGSFAGTTTITPSGDQETFVLTFSGTGITGGSLPDGGYRLTVKASSVTDAYGQTLAGGDQVFSFHRLFGDADGNRQVDAADLVAFRNALRGAVPGFAWWFDFDGNGAIDSADYAAIRLRLIRPLL